MNLDSLPIDFLFYNLPFVFTRVWEKEKVKQDKKRPAEAFRLIAGLFDYIFRILFAHP